jgi:hypothetical protein
MTLLADLFSPECKIIVDVVARRAYKGIMDTKNKLITWKTFNGRPAIIHSEYEDGTVRVRFHPVKGEKHQTALLVKRDDPRFGTSSGMDFLND